MATKTLITTFPSALAASTAARHIEQYGVDPSAVALQGAQLRARVDDAYCPLVLESLRKSGGMDVAIIQNAPDSEDWMGHHNGRTTSAGVPPGQGDSEAGTS